MHKKDADDEAGLCYAGVSDVLGTGICLNRNKGRGGMAGGKLMGKITVLKPDSGSESTVAIQHGQTYVFDFFPEVASTECEGKDVRLVFDDGARILLQNFLSEASAGEFYLELPDGSLLLGKDVAEALSLALQDLIPSAQFYLDETAMGAGSENFDGPESSAAKSAASAVDPAQEPDHKPGHGVGESFSGHGADTLAFDGIAPGDSLFPFAGTDSAPICTVVCNLPSGNEAPSVSFGTLVQDDPLDSFISPFSAAGSVSSGFPLLHGEPGEHTASPLLFSHSFVSGELLLMEDLLDLSTHIPLGAAEPSAFESIFTAPPEVHPAAPLDGHSNIGVDTISAGPISDASDLLLAYLRIASM